MVGVKVDSAGIHLLVPEPSFRGSVHIIHDSNGEKDSFFQYCWIGDNNSRPRPSGGCTMSTVENKIRRPGRPRKLTAKDEAQMVADYVEVNGTLREIAARYGCSMSLVYVAFDRAGRAAKEKFS